MKKLESGRTEYQEFLYSLFIKYGIDSPDELWSNSVWKVIVDNRVSNYARENFYKELSEFNIKNPSDENWTHTSDKKLEEIKTKDENDEIREKTNAEFIRRKIKETQINVKGKENLEEVESEEETEEKRIADAKKAEEESIAATKKAEEEKSIADAKKAEEESIAAAKKAEEEKHIAAKNEEEIETEGVESTSLFKHCQFCAEDIKKEAIICKHCGLATRKIKKYKQDYEVSEALSVIVTFVGYAIIGIGIMYPIVTDMFGYRTPEVVVFSYFAIVIILGISLIVSGQMIRALVDNTNANREILWILKAKQKHEGWVETHYVEKDLENDRLRQELEREHKFPGTYL